MASSSARVWKVVKPHTPLIKFKRGSLVRTHVSADSHSIPSPASSSASSQASSKPIGSSARGSGIDEALLPKRYHRKQITPQEIETIERGGFEI